MECRNPYLPGAGRSETRGLAGVGAHASLASTGPHVAAHSDLRRTTNVASARRGLDGARYRERLQAYAGLSGAGPPPRTGDARDLAGHLSTTSLRHDGAPAAMRAFEAPALKQAGACSRSAEALGQGSASAARDAARCAPRRAAAPGAPPPPFARPPAACARALLFLANADVAACAAVSAYWADELLLDYAALRVQFGALLPGIRAPSFLASLAALAAARGARGCARRAGDGLRGAPRRRVPARGCVAWGRNDSGQTGDARLAGGPAGPPLPAWVAGLPERTPPVAAAAGADHSVFLDSDGAVYDCGVDGAGDRPIPRPVSSRVREIARRVVAVAAGERYTLALTTRGEVYSWGECLFGALGTGAFLEKRARAAVGLPRTTRVSAGPHHALGRAGLRAPAATPAAATRRRDVAGDRAHDRARPEAVALAGDVVDASAAAPTPLAGGRGRAVFGFGLASFGRTGVDVGWPRRANVWRPEAVALAARVVRVAAGASTRFALDDGGAPGPGAGRAPRARDGARRVRARAPVKLPSPAVAIAAHAAHARGDGAGDDGAARLAWGRGDHGRLGVADAFGNCDIRDRATPTVVTLPSEADRRRHARAPYY
ncbi:guanyl-nucleotide exchange factor [Aureococcus anophagefferens]|uniref:Guanyl-nucleotide exchange factor n=1 Tax=Aureococcus anophagefferens TaxID=44056 RepID=A0ABR1G8L3_AURAN